MSQITPADAIKLLLNPNISKTVVLQLVWQKAKLIEKGSLISKALGSVIVGVSSVIRIPQIKKILTPLSLKQRISVVNGLSLEGISLETLGYLIHVIYNLQNNNPFVNFGETGLLGIQNIAIILLIRYFKTREEGASEVGGLLALLQPILLILGVTIGLAKYTPVDVIQNLQVLNIPISIILKLPQIRKNYRLKSTGSLSNITVGANFLGSLVRVFTTLQDFEKLGNDYVLLFGYGSSFALNTILAGQCLIYGDNHISEEKKNK